jgi:hypothetical protein
MKYLTLNKNQIKTINNYANDKNRNFIILQKCSLQNGDELLLIAEKEQYNNIRIYWTNSKNKVIHYDVNEAKSVKVFDNA